MQANFSELNAPPQATSTLAERIRWVLKKFGLQQEQLAQLMGVNLDRVKSLVLGRAAKLRLAEVHALGANLGLVREWLEAGVLPAVRHAVVAEHAPAADVARDVELLARDAAARPYGGAVADPALLQQAVALTAAEIDARGLVLSPQKRLELYWAVFVASAPAGMVNRAAIGPIVSLAASRPK